MGELSAGDWINSPLAVELRDDEFLITAHEGDGFWQVASYGSPNIQVTRC